MKFNKGDMYVMLVIVLNVIFAGIVLFISYKVQYEPTVLVGGWFTTFTAELFILSRIKLKKGDEVEKNDDEVDE